MKYFYCLFLASISTNVFAIKSIENTTIIHVQQQDSESTQFEITSSTENSCGSSTYIVKSPNNAVATRKFSLILTALTTNKKVSFNDTEICDGNRSVITWIRLLH